EALQILRLLWSDRRSVTFQGEFYQLRGAHPGPSPAHPIRVWVGGYGPRMLRLAGREADGVLLSTGYVPPDELPAKMAAIDEGAAQADRPPTAIRRGYNLMGVILLDRPETPRIEARPGLLVGPPAYWVDEIERYYRDLRQDTFIVWPVAGDEVLQVQAFANEVVPAIRERIGS
ncbi:MAG TPA: LLM class flavin-dependent oxidoreductase, partial [Chloroflexi bacterium]|nr:LLM class flavin-dependent oxidoreductase [Chloroflexota bacterium]